jgi:hypothetical protein
VGQPGLCDAIGKRCDRASTLFISANERAGCGFRNTTLWHANNAPFTVQTACKLCHLDLFVDASSKLCADRSVVALILLPAVITAAVHGVSASGRSRTSSQSDIESSIPGRCQEISKL